MFVSKVCGIKPEKKRRTSKEPYSAVSDNDVPASECQPIIIIDEHGNEVNNCFLILLLCPVENLIVVFSTIHIQTILIRFLRENRVNVFSIFFCHFLGNVNRETC